MRNLSSSRWSRFVRCLLLAAAWQAPLPFWHRHGTLADASPEVAAWLSDHLRSQHAALDPYAQVTCGWHLHFAFPESGEQSTDGPDAPRDLPTVEVGLRSWCEVLRLQSASTSWGCRDHLAVGTRSGLERGPVASPVSRGFFTDFAAEMPLPARLGVLRC